MRAIQIPKEKIDSFLKSVNPIVTENQESRLIPTGLEVYSDGRNGYKYLILGQLDTDYNVSGDEPMPSRRWDLFSGQGEREGQPALARTSHLFVALDGAIRVTIEQARKAA